MTIKAVGTSTIPSIEFERRESVGPQSPPNFRKLYNRVVNSDLDRQEKAQFIDRIKTAALQNEVEAKRPNAPTTEVNYRQLFNRVVNSDLDRGDQAKFIERIKNAAAGAPPSEPEPQQDTAAEVTSRRYLGEA